MKHKNVERYSSVVATLSPFLWFTERADEALAFYQRVFGVVPPEGQQDFMGGSVVIGDTELIVFNGGPYADFAFNETVSLFVPL